ncbi:hypothetical protein HBI37_213840 [Parastagonospora nodorum]|nr:hypothetical protein HBI37_213840 [Parastagonospora nodorum]
MFLPCNPLRLLHQQRAIPLVLELLGVARMHRHRRAIHMQLAHQTRRLAREFRAERVFLGALAQPQQRDEDILLGIFVREEGFPPAVGRVVAPHELDLVRPDLVLDFVDADFARAHVATRGAEVFHACEREFAEVSVFHARCDERHGDVALDAVDAGPRWYEGENTGDNIDEGVGGVVFVPSRSPEFVQARPANNQRGIDLQPVGAEVRVCKVLDELVEVALHADVGQVGHHVGDDLEAGVFGEAEGFGNGGDGVPAIGVAGDVFVEGLHADFEARAAVAEHGG